MMKNNWLKTICLIGILGLFAFNMAKKDKRPVLYIIGDSTVKNGSGRGESKMWGWGSFIHEYFDTTKVAVQNHAIGGRSSRTFITEGRWDKIMKDLKKGDVVIMQFGHNDGGPLDDTARARGTFKGIGNESKEIYNPILKKKETVYSYGYYMRKYVNDAKSKGATAIICSPVPRNTWKDGKVARGNDSYTLWAKQIADETKVSYIDLHNIISDAYEVLGVDSVKTFFPVDHTHPNEAGSRLAAQKVIASLKDIKRLKIKKHLI